MSTRKTNYTSRLTETEAQKRSADRTTKSRKRWQQIAFVAVSVIILLSMVLSLFIR